MEFPKDSEWMAKLQVSSDFFEVGETEENLVRGLAGHVGLDYTLVLVGTWPDRKFYFYHPSDDRREINYPDVAVDFKSPSQIKFVVDMESGHVGTTVSLGSKEISQAWPSGARNLIDVIDAIEEYLSKNTLGYKPVLWDWIISQISSNH